ncbi:MAG: hypothetical protein JMDDDDMK_01376 [Acidobacteria bacterium]|nr:hypothetical protein [Acidobacteriota bacterium]
MIQPLHGSEIRLLAAASALSAAASRPPAESAPSDADTCDGLSLIGGVTSAPTERAAELWSQSFRPTGAEVDDNFAFHILARVIIVIGQRRIETVAEEFNLINAEAAFAADVFGKSDSFAVFESARLPVHFNRERRMIRALDAEHAHALEIRTIVAAGFDTQRAQLLGQISGGQPQTFRERGAAFKFVRRQIGQPLLQIFWLDFCAAGFAGLRGNGAKRQAERDCQREHPCHSTRKHHYFSSGLMFGMDGNLYFRSDYG